MDSINQQQPEQTREHLRGKNAVEKIREIVKKAQSGFFCTRDPNGRTVARPMNARKVDDDGTLWFLSAETAKRSRNFGNR